MIRLFGSLAGVALMAGAFAIPGFMRFGAVVEGAPEMWRRSATPQSAEAYQWSPWQAGAGAFRVDPAIEELKGATIVEHRIATRQTFFKDYMFCQGRYKLANGKALDHYALCPSPHVALREGRVEWLAAMVGALGIGVLLTCVLWPSRRMQPTPNGAADPER